MTTGSLNRLSYLLSYFDNHTVAKGQHYFRTGRVRSCTEKNGKIMGIIRGNSDYLATITLLDDEEIKNTKCSCPIGGDCKHTVALVCRYVDQSKSASNSTDNPLPPQESSNSSPANLRLVQKENPAITILPPPPIVPVNKEIPQPVKRPKLNAAVANALSRLSAVSERQRSTEKEGQNSGQRKSKAQIIYSIQERSHSTSPIVLALKVNLRKDGSYGQTSPVSVERLGSYNCPQYVADSDIEIARLWQTLCGRTYYSYYGSTLNMESDAELLHVFLKRILSTGRCYLDEKFDEPLVIGEELEGRLVWRQEASDKQRLCIEAIGETGNHPCLRWKIPWYIDHTNSKFGPVRLPISPELLEHALSIPSVTQNDADNLQFELPELGLDHLIPIPACKRATELRVVKPVPTVRISRLSCQQSTDTRGSTGRNTQKAIALAHHYKEGNNRVIDDNGTIVTIKQDVEQEHKNLELIKSLGFNDVTDEQQVQLENTRMFASDDPSVWFNLFERLPELKSHGWEIPEPISSQLSPIELDDADLNIEIDDENSWWFSLSMNIEVAGKKRPLLPILTAAIRALPDSNCYSDTSIDSLNKNGKFYAMLEDSQLISFPFDRMRPMLVSLHELLLKEPAEKGDKLRLSIMDAENLLRVQEQSGAHWKGASSVVELASRLKKLSSTPQPCLPKTLQAQLRPYQSEGVAWLQMLSGQKFGGILADDMGLGKTVQLLAYICASSEHGDLKEHPFLVVCPKSVLPNWLSECSRFAPKLKVLALSGQDRSSNFNKIKKAELVITSYPLIVRDLEVLKKTKWSGIALDEAQAIKNADTQVAKAACQLSADHRFCLTGTPIENHLGELWSEFQFLLPGFLGDKTTFKTVFRNPIEKEADNSRRSLLAARVKPFILRRTKEEVATDLPEKTVMIRHIELEGRQLDLYETVRLASTKQVRDEVAKKGFKNSQIMILDALLKLRQVCCDPRLVKLSAAAKVAESAKLEALIEMVMELQEEGRKVLVFSQFTSMLDLIADELKRKEIQYVELRGDTRDREAPVLSFQNGEVPVFLLSLKAGGTGLNLTAADTVIHYDPWWNPAVEAQATDRAHRIGQTKNVFVYKLVVKGSIEERMLQLQERKQSLSSAIYSEGGNSKYAFNQDDIEMLLKPLDEI